RGSGAPAAGAQDLDVVHDHRVTGLGTGVRSAAEGVGEAAAHGDVQDDEVAVVRGVRPGRGVDLVGPDGVEVTVVEVEADLLHTGRAVPLQPVGVESGLAGGALTGGRTADAAVLVAGAAGRGAAVHGGEHRVHALRVLHDVELADRGPVPPVAAVGGAQHPARRPVALGGGAGDVRHLDAALDAQFAARRGLEVGPVGLDAAGRPVAGRVPPGRDAEVAV